MISTMTMPSRQQLREWSAALTLGPLDPVDPKETRYVPLADAGRAAVDELLATIELALDTTTQLLSGPSGSGKTTELRRLRGELESAGFHAAIFDVGAYVNESSPIDGCPPPGPPQDFRRRPRPVRHGVTGRCGIRGDGRVGRG
jgi:hypothetical protein